MVKHLKLLQICRSRFESSWNSFNRAESLLLPVYDLGIFCRQKLIEGVLVMGTGLPVHADKERLVSQWLDILLIMRGSKLRDLLDAFFAP
ncbi:MAG: hypothetical protein R3E54_04600 [Halioglobus sp.]